MTAGSSGGTSPQVASAAEAEAPYGGLAAAAAAALVVVVVHGQAYREAERASVAGVAPQVATQVGGGVERTAHRHRLAAMSHHPNRHQWRSKRRGMPMVRRSDKRR